jgi:hypothetical protein
MNDERANRGVEHLQAAAQEMIAAARSFLDVIEDLVADPDKVADVVSAVGDMAGNVSDAARSASSRAKRSGTRGGPGRADEGDERDDPDDGVQRIPVS